MRDFKAQYVERALSGLANPEGTVGRVCDKFGLVVVANPFTVETLSNGFPLMGHSWGSSQKIAPISGHLAVGSGVLKSAPWGSGRAVLVP